jgi:acetyl-CoA C-acetyltransferase
VVVGVARVEGRRDDPLAGEDAVGLMVEAARAALADAGGGTALTAAIGRISMPAGSWPHTDPGAEIARRLGCGPIGRTLYQAGVSQQDLFDDAHERIARGETDAVLVVGGEAAARTQAAKRAGVELDGPTFDGEPDDVRVPDVTSIVTDAEIAAGLYDPPVVYALLDDAFRAAAGQTPAARREHVSEMWAAMSEVAATDPHAAFGTPRSPRRLRTPSDENRLIALPYTKWLCSQLHVDQAAAILVTSLELARRLALDRDRLVVPLLGLHSSTAVPVAARRHLGAWPAMRVLGDAAGAHLGRPLAALDHVEVYSCFPVAVSMAQDALGLPTGPAPPPTITGGLTFAGGPWNNFVLQSTAAMVDRVRAEPGTTGLVTTVSGFVHKPGLAVYGTDPAAPEPLVADLGAECAAATEALPTTADHRGSATIVAATVRPERDGSRTVIVIGETAEGTRVVATGAGRDDLAAAIEQRGIVGEAVEVDGVALAG